VIKNYAATLEATLSVFSLPARITFNLDDLRIKPDPTYNVTLNQEQWLKTNPMI
jgi:hypothetical protein